mmetsp:Transcript_5192/g.15036  ORF Transcript_5192/g.15036 Transcript_5192/m.15036 type:complete len:98 (+) Transcript_5192:2-295(+)
MDITEYALPTDRGLTRGDGQLVDFLRCVAVRVGRALLYQQFGDLHAVARRFRASQRAAALGHSQTAETVTATFPHARLSMARMSSQDLHARPVDGTE